MPARPHPRALPRPQRLLLISTAGIGAAQLLLGLSFSMGRVVWLALAGQFLFMAAFSIGAGPCSMIVASELFPLQVLLLPSFP